MLCLLLAAAGARAPTISSDECRPCGSSTCFNSVCRADVCGTAFVRDRYESSGYVVDMPSPCAEGPYTCSEDAEDASLLCTPGDCAFAVPCAPPRRGDVRLQPTELSQVLELHLGQVLSSPPSGLLMVYGMSEPDRWSIACADASPERDRAVDAVCRQLGSARGVSSKMVSVGPLLEQLSSAFPSGRGGSLLGGVATFGHGLRTLFGEDFGQLSGNTYPMRSCALNASGAEAGAGSEPPASILGCGGAPLVEKSCSRTNALHVSCAAELYAPPSASARSRPAGARLVPAPTAACGSASISKLQPCAHDERTHARKEAPRAQAAPAPSKRGSGRGDVAPSAAPALATCPPLFLPNAQEVAGGLYCVHHPQHAAESPQDRARAFRARVAAGVARGASSAPLPADSEASADEEAARACEEALASGDLGQTMDRCAAASGFAHPAAAAALAQAHANGANDAAAKAAAEAAGIAGLNALLAASLPPPADPLAGVSLPPVICFLGRSAQEPAEEGGASAFELLQATGAPPNAGNTTRCEAFDTRPHCPSDRWAAVLLPSGAYFCAGAAPAQPQPAAGLPRRVRDAAGIFDGAPPPFVLCHQTGPNALHMPRCVPRTEPRLSAAVLSPIGVHLDPRPQARPPGPSAPDGADHDCSLELAAVVTHQGLAPAGCARAPLAPELCAAGVHCPNLFNRAVCPRGAFCWEGSTRPAPCDTDVLGGLLPALLGRALGALLGAAPAGAADACPPGTERPPPRTDFLPVLGLVLGAALCCYAAYDRSRAAHHAALLAVGEDSGAAQRSTAFLYVQLDALYARAALSLAPALTPKVRSAGDRRSGAQAEPLLLSSAALCKRLRAHAQPYAQAAAARADALLDYAPPSVRAHLHAARDRAGEALLCARQRIAAALAPLLGGGAADGGAGRAPPAAQPLDGGAGGAGGGERAPGCPPGRLQSPLQLAGGFLSPGPDRRATMLVTPHAGAGGAGADGGGDEVVVPPAMSAAVERARRRQAEGLAAVHPDSEAPFAKFPDRISFQFTRLGMKVRAPPAVVARRRRAAAERTAERAAGGAGPREGPSADGSGWTEVLHSVSGSIEHSSLTAIMGVSGCGKSSFMNVLCGRAGYGLPTGTLLVNGERAELERLRSRIGYVPQDDTVREALSVYENILYAARLRLPRGTAEARVRGLTHEVVEMLGLQSVRDSVVGSVEVRGISGGQRKRVNIGIELAADPLALFLDEPTSGLDACTAEIVLSALRSLARRGRTVVIVLHQPRYTAFKLLDRLILLGVGGRTLFCGEPLKVVPYFASVGYSMRYGENPADFMLDVVSGLVPRDPKRASERYERAERALRGAQSADGRAPPASADGRTPSSRASSPPRGAHSVRKQPSALASASWRGGTPRASRWAQLGGWDRAGLRASATLPAGAGCAARGAQGTPGGPGGGAYGGGRGDPPSPTGTADTSEPTAPRAARPRGPHSASVLASKKLGSTAASGVATTAVLAECWAQLGHTIGGFENEAAPVSALFTQEQQLAVLRVFEATLEAAWPGEEREELTGSRAQHSPPDGCVGADGGYVYADLLEQLSAGRHLPPGARLPAQAAAERARNRWRAAARAVATSRRPAPTRATLAIRRIGLPLHVHAVGGLRPPARPAGTDPPAACGAAGAAEPSEAGAELPEGAADDEDDPDETLSLPDIPATPSCHTRSRRLARAHPSLSRQLASAASAGCLPVGDWAAFLQALQELASMSVITREQVDLVAACLHEQLRRASDAAGAPLVGGTGLSQPGSPGGSVAEVADEDELGYDLESADHGEDAPAAAAEWDVEDAAEAMGVSFSRAELEALLRITDDNPAETMLELRTNGVLTAADYYDYQSDVHGLSEAEIWAKWSRMQQLQLSGETAGLSGVGARKRGPSHLDFAAAGPTDASRRVTTREAPSFLAQLATLTASYGAQQRRLASGSGALSEWAVLVLVGGFVGVLQRSQLPDGYEKLPTIYVLTLTLFSLFVALPAVRTFSFDKLSFWREASAGISPTAFYCSRALADLPGLSLRAVVFALVFWSCAFWSGSLSVLIGLFLAVMLCASGLAYVIAITVPPSLAVTVCGVLICSLCGFFAGIVPTIREAGPVMRLTLDLSYGRWAAQCLASADFLEIPSALYAEQGRQLIALFAWPSAEELEDAGRGPCSQPIGVLVVLGLLLRVLGCVAINYANGTQFGRAPLCNPAPRMRARRVNAKVAAARSRTSRKSLTMLGPNLSRASSSML